MVLLLLVGWITDRGSNPRRRKTIAMICGAGLLGVGMSLVVAANMLHLKDLMDYNEGLPEVKNQSDLWNVSSTTVGCFSGEEVQLSAVPERSQETWQEEVFGIGQNYSSENSFMEEITSKTLTRNGTAGRNETNVLPEVSLKAGVGLLAFILLDMGFDAINSFTKSFILTCTPRCEHTSVLLVGLVMASAGGVSTASLGVVDFTSLLGLSHIQGSSLCIQTTVQALVVMILVIVGLLTTLLTGRYQLRRHRDMDGTNTPILDDETSQENISCTCEDVMSVGHRKHNAEALSESIPTNSKDQKLSCSANNGKALVKADETFPTSQKMRCSEKIPLSVSDGKPDKNYEAFPSSQKISCSEKNPLIAKNGNASVKTDETLSAAQKMGYSEKTPLLASKGKVSVTADGSFLTSQPPFVTDSCKPENATSGSGLSELSLAETTTADYSLAVEAADIMNDGGPKLERCGPLGFKGKVACVCISAYFSNGTLMMFTYTSSDFVGKAIYGGNPHAAPGSESLSRYQEGLRTASWGFLVYCFSYLLTSLVHQRVLAKLGYRVEFVLANLLLGMSLMTLALTTRLEVFFVTAVVAGFYRACLHLVPYAVMNDVMQSASSNSSEGKTKEGLAMSLVSACIPLTYCTIFTLMGPLEHFTGLVSVPLWLGTGLGCVSAVSFLFLGKV